MPLSTTSPTSPALVRSRSDRRTDPSRILSSERDPPGRFMCICATSRGEAMLMHELERILGHARS